MTPQDEQELDRLTEILKSIDDKVGADPTLREALQKAALALHIAFIQGLRPEMESQFQQLGQPLVDSQRSHLRSMGIEPD